ncbi:MAG: tetratricopeptide repeat protein [Syntrophales bacterium]|nr:tetratricopeptide repeat protein [Syntrophales bacterium]
MRRKNLVVITIILFIICGVTGCATNHLKEERANARLDVGIAYIKAGQYTAALKELLEAKKLSPRNPEIHYYLGISYHGKGLVNESIGEFEEAVNLNPDYSEAHNYLGTVYFNKGLWDKAIKEFNKALANVLYATPASALYNMGRAYYQKGNYRMALAKYNEAMIKGPNIIPLPLIEKDMGVASFELGEIDSAIGHFKRSLKLVPTFVESHYWLGRCYVKQGDVQGAIEELETVIETAPESEFGEKAKEILKAIER